MERPGAYVNNPKSTAMPPPPRRGTPYDGCDAQTRPCELKNRYTHGFYNRQAGGAPTGSTTARPAEEKPMGS